MCLAKLEGSFSILGFYLGYIGLVCFVRLTSVEDVMLGQLCVGENGSFIDSIFDRPIVNLM